VSKTSASHLLYNRTLTDAEVITYFDRIAETAAKQLGAVKI